jgi:hypothetical protein
MLEKESTILVNSTNDYYVASILSNWYLGPEIKGKMGKKGKF